ncbi:uncharacterized protein IWZ02DRAFT_456196, partial [Phyllosticta citriasiana]
MLRPTKIMHPIVFHQGARGALSLLIPFLFRHSRTLAARRAAINHRQNRWSISQADETVEVQGARHVCQGVSIPDQEGESTPVGWPGMAWLCSQMRCWIGLDLGLGVGRNCCGGGGGGCGCGGRQRRRPRNQGLPLVAIGHRQFVGRWLLVRYLLCLFFAPPFRHGTGS